MLDVSNFFVTFTHSPKISHLLWHAITSLNQIKGRILSFSQIPFLLQNLKLPNGLPAIKPSATLRCHWNDTNNICCWVWQSATGSKAIWHCNANDCIHQMSFVSYSLCSLSSLSKALVAPQCAQMCVTVEERALIRQCRVQWERPAKAPHPLPSP